MRNDPALLVIAAGLLVNLAAEPGLAQNECVSCHFDTADFETFEHLLAWDQSPHARSGVSCQSCHRGDPTTRDLTRAHQAILSSWNPASPVHPAGLPATCGGCHTGPLAAFQESRHFELLSAGAPTCRTCHGSVGAEVPTPTGVERVCGACHGPDGPNPRPGRAERARATIDHLTETRQLLTATSRIIERIQAPSRQQELAQEVTLVEESLRRAADGFHRFVLDGVEAQLLEADADVDRLIDRILDPPPSP